MRRRDYPQIGDVWANSDGTTIFTVLDKVYNEAFLEWDLTIVVCGEDEKQNGIQTAHMSEDFSELDGVYWKVT